jgi:hypothetical protein
MDGERRATVDDLYLVDGQAELIAGGFELKPRPKTKHVSTGPKPLTISRLCTQNLTANINWAA